MLEEQKNELSEQVEDEAKPIEFDANAEEVTSKSDRFDEKPDINDVPTDENKVCYFAYSPGFCFCSCIFSLIVEEFQKPNFFSIECKLSFSMNGSVIFPSYFSLRVARIFISGNCLFTGCFLDILFILLVHSSCFELHTKSILGRNGWYARG